MIPHVPLEGNRTYVNEVDYDPENRHIILTRVLQSVFDLGFRPVSSKPITSQMRLRSTIANLESIPTMISFPS
jgi:hypothetical protein